MPDSDNDNHDPDAPASGPVPRSTEPAVDADTAQAGNNAASPGPSANDNSDGQQRPPSTPSAIPCITRFAGYEVLGRLAVGGMAELYQARERKQGVARNVALKVLSADATISPEGAQFETRFLREGQVAVQLSHPNIGTVYEFGKWGGHFFIAMEYVDGVSMKEVVDEVARRDALLPIPVAVAIIAQVAGALGYAHSAKDTNRQPLGIVHRDISPHNIMVRFDGVVSLLDFGVVQVEHSEHKTTTGALVGKFPYMSPEQVRSRPLDGRSDLFSLGACLFEFLTGKRLFRRDSQIETCMAVAEATVPSVRVLREEVPEALDRIVHKLLTKDPDKRFRTGDQLQLALEDWLASNGEPSGAARLSRYARALFPELAEEGRTLETDPKVIARIAPRIKHPRLSSGVLPSAEEIAEAQRNAGLNPTDPYDADVPPAELLASLPSRGGSSRGAWLGTVAVLVCAVFAAFAGTTWWLTERSLRDSAPAATVVPEPPPATPEPAPAPAVDPVELSAPVSPDLQGQAPSDDAEPVLPLQGDPEPPLLPLRGDPPGPVLEIESEDEDQPDPEPQQEAAALPSAPEEELVEPVAEPQPTPELSAAQLEAEARRERRRQERRERRRRRREQEQNALVRDPDF